MISKSERKRRHKALQDLGEKLIGLGECDLSSLSLDERLVDAIRAAASIRSHEALRRQKQLIGKLMRNVDPAPIEAALATITADDVRNKQLFAQAERWRRRLLEMDSSGLPEFEAFTDTIDLELRQLISDHNAAYADRERKRLSREIFGRVHQILGKIP